MSSGKGVGKRGRKRERGKREKEEGDEGRRKVGVQPWKLAPQQRSSTRYVDRYVPPSNFSKKYNSSTSSVALAIDMYM